MKASGLVHNRHSINVCFEKAIPNSGIRLLKKHMCSRVALVELPCSMWGRGEFPGLDAGQAAAFCSGPHPLWGALPRWSICLGKRHRRTDRIGGLWELVPGEWVQELGRFKNKNLGKIRWLFLSIWKAELWKRSWPVLRDPGEQNYYQWVEVTGTLHG